MPWLSRIDFQPTDPLHAYDLNNLGNDVRVWGGNVNGGGYTLGNVVLDMGTVSAQYHSPLVVVPAVGQADTQLVLKQDLGGGSYSTRWSIVKDAGAETGGNAGSDFQIVRFSDAGAAIDAPIGIRRSDGLVTLKAQHWTGPIDGGGQTLTNVVIPGAGAVASVFGRTGAIVAQAGDYTAAQVGALADPTTQKGDLIVHGAGGITRLGVGADGYMVYADSSKAEGLRWGPAPSGGTGGGSQTPWLSDIDGGGHNLVNAGGISMQGDLALAGPAKAASSGRSIVFTSTGDGASPLNAYVQVLSDPTPGLRRLALTVIEQQIAFRNITLNEIGGGYVGIGTTQPQRNLHIAGVVGGKGLAVTGSAPCIQMSNADGEPNTPSTVGVSWVLAKNAGDYTLPNAGDTAIFTQGTARGDIHIMGNYTGSSGPVRNVLLQPTGGNVGIGVGTPSNLLSFPAALGDKLTFYNGSMFGFGIQTNLLQMMVPINSDIAFGVGASASFTERVRIVGSSGAVGIGSSGPAGEAATAKLVVVGAAGQNAGNLTEASTKALAYFRADGGHGEGLAFGVIGNLTQYLQGVIFNAGGVAKLALNPFGGNVGIAQVLPAYALDVSGDVNCTGSFRVNGTPLATGGGGGVTTQTKPSRLINTVYQNTTGKPLFVMVSVQINSGAEVLCYADPISSTSVWVGKTSNTGGGSEEHTMSWWVLPNYYYRIFSSGSYTLVDWTEWS